MPTPEQLDLQEALAYAATELQVLYADTCDILAGDHGETPYGTAPSSDVVVAAGVACRLRQLGGREADDAARIATTASWAFDLAPDTPLSERSRIRHEGRLYHVVHVPTNTHSVRTTAWVADGGAA